MNLKIVKPELSKAEFLTLLTETFPETREDVLDPDYDDLIHLQVGILANYANKCVEIKRFDELKKVFDFFEATEKKVDSDIENALYVSFLEHVDFEGLDEKEIKKYLKPHYFDAWRILRGS